MELDELRHQDFAARLGDTFTIQVDGAEISLELITATQPPEDRPDHAHFVEWKGPLEPFLEQRIYELAHPHLGVLPIFLVPVNQVEDGFVYEAVFTRIND